MKREVLVLIGVGAIAVAQPPPTKADFVVPARESRAGAFLSRVHLPGPKAPQHLLAQSDFGDAPQPAVPPSPSPEDSALPGSEPPTVASVHVIADDIDSDEGTVRLALCDSGLTVEGCPYQMSVPAALGYVELTFEDIPPGAYAVVGYQDLNDDNRFDMFLGVPREPYALSGAAADMLVPTFEGATVELVPGANDVLIRMKRIW